MNTVNIHPKFSNEKYLVIPINSIVSAESLNIDKARTLPDWILEYSFFFFLVLRWLDILLESKRFYRGK